MNDRNKQILFDILRSMCILTLSFLGSLVVQDVWNARSLIPSVFVLAVFLVSLLTQGYVFGILSALISVLAVNFAFTFPYFEFNFSIHENAVSALIMIVVTTVTSALTTKLKRQEIIKAESEKEKMRANLLRAISHDLRTPLTSIYGASSTMIDNYSMLETDDHIQMLKGIREDSQWLIRMVENILSVTKIDNNNLALNKNSIVLEELVDSVLMKFQKLYPEQPIVTELPEEFILVSADAILVEQVLMNFLENAVQHAHGMMKLELLISVEDERVLFSVIDDGCGMTADQKKDLFSGRLGSVQDTSDSKRQFIGIGLSVCAAIIKAHGGQVWGRNNPERGMEFGFWLEREKVEDE